MGHRHHEDVAVLWNFYTSPESCVCITVVLDSNILGSILFGAY